MALKLNKLNCAHKTIFYCKVGCTDNRIRLQLNIVVVKRCILKIYIYIKLQLQMLVWVTINKRVKARESLSPKIEGFIAYEFQSSG